MAQTIEKLPTELLLEILMFLDVDDVCRMSSINSFWKNAGKNEILWKKLTQKHFPQIMDNQERLEKYKPSQESTWKLCFETIWISRYWELNTGDRLRNVGCVDIFREGTTVLHNGPGIFYIALRANRGYSKGKHAWQVKLDSVTCNAYNIYIGISLKELTPNNHLGTDFTSWAIRGGDGKFYHGDVESDFGHEFFSGDVIDCFLDCDSCLLGFTINGKLQGVRPIPEISGKEVFPAVSLIEQSDLISCSFHMPLPELDSTSLRDLITAGNRSTRNLYKATAY